MLLRLGATAATHAAAGFAFGVLGVLAACTVARTAAEAGRCATRRPTREPEQMDLPMGDVRATEP